MGRLAGLAYWSSKFSASQAGPGTNFGWPEQLAFDKYPPRSNAPAASSVVCRLGYESSYGPVWDEVIEQMWANIQQNYAIIMTITLANNITGKGLESFEKSVNASM